MFNVTLTEQELTHLLSLVDLDLRTNGLNALEKDVEIVNALRKAVRVGDTSTNEG